MGCNAVARRFFFWGRRRILKPLRVRVIYLVTPRSYFLTVYSLFGGIRSDSLFRTSLSRTSHSLQESFHTSSRCTDTKWPLEYWPLSPRPSPKSPRWLGIRVLRPRSGLPSHLRLEDGFHFAFYRLPHQLSIRPKLSGQAWLPVPRKRLDWKLERERYL